MQMLHCPNCGKLTGFKRSLGFGTFFMVLLTAGLWLLVIPLYPARCITCGLTRHAAVFHNFNVWYRSLSPAARAFVVIAPLVLLFGLGIFNALSNPSQPNPPTTFTANNALDSNAENDVPISNAPPNDEDKVISIDAASLLSAYQTDEKTAIAQFENRKVAVTGVLTGVFIPSIDVSMRVAASGGTADAFVTMGGPSPASAEETLLLPGITAYSEASSLFGQQSMNAITDQLNVGETVTLVCTCKDALRVSDLAISRYNGTVDYSVTLEDCTLQNNSQPESPNPGPAQIQSSQEAAAPGSTPTPEDAAPAPVAEQPAEEQNQNSETQSRSSISARSHPECDWTDPDPKHQDSRWSDSRRGGGDPGAANLSNHGCQTRLLLPASQCFLRRWEGFVYPTVLTPGGERACV